ncbi:uncharacterized protein LOC144617944 [Crassostrea virginica]
MMKKQSAPFMMSTCSFKNTLHHFLRNLFSKTLWLNVPSEEFQSEIKRCLHRDGWDNDTGVFKTVCSFSYVKFTEFRNQLRRKLAEHKKTDPRSMLLQEFCRIIFAPFVKSGESLLSKERRQNALLIRSYLYRQKHFILISSQVDDSDLSYFLRTAEAITVRPTCQLSNNLDTHLSSTSPSAFTEKVGPVQNGCINTKDAYWIVNTAGITFTSTARRKTFSLFHPYGGT